ncbi:hypothetical protein GCM10011376_25590 [Nocardioides flavus (ex Wang et al. 2016)]|uniref:Restriction endonuclease n=1 Tax=Nocardioides flavus (ex Wang et al. 2016) TaxID=2058780 RepID=A0ABQ3HMQ0_9ACTN|nr:hypothetical protein [Nocardioides flavus (ex Wang et al. 2016)]GHE17949.1 hypothetical protein GCM10011376_25590 [Nocardioides flavus (ex Wang et al. 2016)]
MAAIDLPFGWDRPYRYGQAFAALSLGEPGTEELFNTALTHGLLAIAAATIDGHPARVPGRQPSASVLLRDLVGAFGEADGVCLVPNGAADVPNPFGVFGDDYKPPVETVVRTGLLAEALKVADAARHGSGPKGELTEQHVAALEDLDAHPALRSIGDARRDRDWSDGTAADSQELGRAADYLEFLPEDEIERRVEQAPSSPAAPDYFDAAAIQACPVCGYETLIPTGGDEMGYGITAGTCFVCSYTRSEDAAHDLQSSAEFRRLWERDHD